MRPQPPGAAVTPPGTVGATTSPTIVVVVVLLVVVVVVVVVPFGQPARNNAMHTAVARPPTIDITATRAAANVAPSRCGSRSPRSFTRRTHMRPQASRASAHNRVRAS